MTHKLTGKQRADFQQAFDIFKDENGNIPNEKLYTVIKSLVQDMPDQELTLMIKYVDADSSGEIDIEEFLAMMASHLGLDEPDDVKDAFKCLDSEMEGKISTEDLRYVLDNIGDKLSEEQMTEMILELDPDTTGKISYQRFKEVFSF